MFAFVRWLIILAIYAGALGACSNDSRPAPTAEPREGHVSSSSGVQLHYRILGTSGDTIVVLHGGPGLDLGYLAPDLEPLTDSHVLIVYDQRGAGRSTLVSDSATVNIGAHIGDLEAVRRHFGIGRMTLLGHSWGALLAAYYAREHSPQLSRLLLVSPAPPRRTPFIQQLGPNVTAWMDSTTLAKVDDLRAARQDTSRHVQSTCRAFWEVFRRGYFADPHDSATIQRMRGDFCTASDPAIRNGAIVNLLTLASVGEWDLRNSLNDVSIPVLVITGTSDIFPVEAMREWEAAFPNASLVLLEDAGHYPHVEQPEMFFGTVTEFLR